jgi:hypothetical protein
MRPPLLEFSGLKIGKDMLPLIIENKMKYECSRKRTLNHISRDPSIKTRSRQTFWSDAVVDAVGRNCKSLLRNCSHTECSKETSLQCKSCHRHGAGEAVEGLISPCSLRTFRDGNLGNSLHSMNNSLHGSTDSISTNPLQLGCLGLSFVLWDFVAETQQVVEDYWKCWGGYWGGYWGECSQATKFVVRLFLHNCTRLSLLVCLFVPPRCLPCCLPLPARSVLTWR